MIGWGVFLLIIGLVNLSNEGAYFVVVGLILIAVGADKKGTNQNTGDSISSIKDKIYLITKFYQSLIDMKVQESNNNEYRNIINFYNNLKNSAANLNYQGVNLINNDYDRITKIYDDLYNKVNDKYKSLDDCSLSFSYIKLASMINDAEKNLQALLKLNLLLEYLLLVSNKLSVSEKGYKNYDVLSFGFPEEPAEIHIYAIICLYTKKIIDGNDPIIFDGLYELLDNINSEADLRKILRKLYKDKLYQLKKLYEEDNDDTVLALILFLDPSSSKQYDKNNKFYEKLGLDKNATKEEIDNAYKKMLLLAHPDRGGDNEEWAKINEAYVKIKDLN